MKLLFSRVKSKFNFELICYFTVYIVYIIYGFLAIYNVRDKIIQMSVFKFASGWQLFVDRPRDDSNDELEVFNEFIYNWWHWYLIHMFVIAFVRLWCTELQSISHAVVCIAALICSVRLMSVVLIVLLIFTFYICAKYKSRRSIVWCLSGIWLVLINYIKYSEFWFNDLGYSEYFLLITTLSWSLLRCCSYAFYHLNDDDDDDENTYPNTKTTTIAATNTLTSFLGYTLYFPNLVYGPYIGYERYVGILQTNSQMQRTNFVCHLKKLCWELIRVAFWWLIMHLALHVFYIHYMMRDVSAVQLVTPAYRRHAVGYFMGQFFFLYYVITYGLGIAIARFDGLNAPNKPRCIGCIHFYSDMWKYFDEGLYEFLFRNIYTQLCGKKSPNWQKIFAIAATFGFVYIWHGCYTYVLLWSFLNFFCLIIEKCYKALLLTRFFETTIVEYVGKDWSDRLRALIATQIFIPAAFSNVYFISGKEVGDCLMRGAYLNGIWNYLALTLSSYCFFQCAETLKKYPTKLKNI